MKSSNFLTNTTAFNVSIVAVLFALASPACVLRSRPTESRKVPAPTVPPQVIRKKAPSPPKRHAQSKPEKKTPANERLRYVSTDGSLAVEVIDDIPSKLKTGQDYRVTHYVRNLTTHVLQGEMGTSFSFTNSHGGEMTPKNEYTRLEPGATKLFSRVIRFDEFEGREVGEREARLRFSTEGGATYFKSIPRDMALSAHYTLTPADKSSGPVSIGIPKKTFEVSTKRPFELDPPH